MLALIDTVKDTVVCSHTNGGELYHLDIGQAIAKTSNEGGDCRIIPKIAEILIGEARSLYLNESDLEVDKISKSQITIR
jgi:hypothetical protein